MAGHSEQTQRPRSAPLATSHAAAAAEIERGPKKLPANGVVTERIVATILLAVVIWIAQFAKSRHFGLYEDDWDFIGQPMTWNLTKLAGWIQTCLLYWPQGRPVGFAIVPLAAFTANHIGGLWGIFVIAFALHLLNSFLVFTIARRHLSPSPALCAALAFALFPADTSVPLLTNALFLGLTTLFLLSAILLYLNGWRVLSYLVSACSLLTFESAFLPFFVVPVLVKDARGKLFRRLATHCGAMLGVGTTLFFIRAHMGEQKAANVLGDGVLETVHRSFTSMWMGPWTTLKAAFTRLDTTWRSADSAQLLQAGLILAAIAAVLLLLKVYTSDMFETWPLALKTPWCRVQTKLTLDEATAGAVRLGGGAVLMFVGAYALDISSDVFPPTTIDGRLSGAAHIAGEAGFALLCGSVAALLLDLAATYRKKWVAAVLIAGYFSGLAGFHYRVQDDFVASWRMQRTFWQSVLKECPDLTDGTILIYEDFSHPLHYVETNSWADPYVLTEVFQFPKEWKQPPQLFPVVPSWKAGIRDQGGKLILNQPFGAWPDRVLTNGNVILLKAQGSGVRRITGTITIQSRALELKPVTNQATTTPRNVLYPYVTQRD